MPRPLRRLVAALVLVVAGLLAPSPGAAQIGPMAVGTVKVNRPGFSGGSIA